MAQEPPAVAQTRFLRAHECGLSSEKLKQNIAQARPAGACNRESALHKILQGFCQLAPTSRP
eukprot:7967585-Heterocapsa_arctica.AAC.1